MTWVQRAITCTTIVVLSIDLVLAQVPRPSTRLTFARTPDGHPDLQGVWSNNTVTPFERPKALAGKQLLTEAEIAVFRDRATRLFSGVGDTAPGEELFEALLANPTVYTTPRRGGDYNQFWMSEDLVFERRTSQVIEPADGHLPPLSAAGERRQAARAEARRLHPRDGPEDLSPLTRCLSHGVIKMGWVQSRNNSYYQIIQTPDTVVLYAEMVGEVRVIPLNDRPPAPGRLRRWLGDSRGHWSGNTLIVETRNLHPGATFSPGAGESFSAENFHIVERFSLIDQDTLEYHVTVDDPTTWARPWTAVTTWSRSPNRIFEYACHEGNYALPGILRGARTDEQTIQAPNR